jgi:hypothetical protein
MAVTSTLRWWTSSRLHLTLTASLPDQWRTRLRRGLSTRLCYHMRAMYPCHCLSEQITATALSRKLPVPLPKFFLPPSDPEIHRHYNYQSLCECTAQGAPDGSTRLLIKFLYPCAIIQTLVLVPRELCYANVVRDIISQVGQLLCLTFFGACEMW